MAFKAFVIFIIVSLMASTISAALLELSKNLNTCDIEPKKETSVQVGESVQILCSTNQPLGECRVEIPGEGSMVLSGTEPPKNGIEYYGNGLISGQCGVRIARVKEYHNGIFKCFLTTCETQQETTASLNIVVANDDMTRIAGGVEANPGQFPYMAVVHQLYGGGRIGQCGGTIVNKRWVLTAAHCVENYPRRFHLSFGIINKAGIEYGRGVSMIATQVVIHPFYRHGHNDIALIYVPQDIPFSNVVRPIKLASPGESFAYREAYVIGWGKDKQNSRGTEMLKYASVPIIQNSRCRQYWNITASHICTAEGLGRDACQGDSGGPLIVVQNGQDIQIGIVSYGDAFCPSNLPGVFTRVSSYKNWIYQVLNYHVLIWD